MKNPRPLKPEQLAWRCPEALVSQTSAKPNQKTKATKILGQDRAIKSLSFGLDIKASGFNVFVYGPQGSGRHKAVMEFISQKAEKEAPPNDWVYVQNFEIEHKPVAIPIQSGEGPVLKIGIEHALQGVAGGLTKLLDSAETKQRIRAVESEFQASLEVAFQKIKEAAIAASVGVHQTAHGFRLFPLKDDKPIEQAEYDELSKEKKEDFENAIKTLQEDVAGYLTDDVPVIERTRQEKLRELYQQLAVNLVRTNFKEIREKYSENEKLQDHFKSLEKDLAKYAPHLASLSAKVGKQNETIDQLSLESELRRYEVNVLITDGKKGAPVIYEDWPGLGRLIGRIEHILQMGALETDFQLIKAGSLHKANGGYLLVDARRVLSSPGSWETLKRAIRNKKITIESPYNSLSSMTTVTLEPESIPLNVKILMFGDRRTYYLLSELDPDFPQLFKVAAEFEDTLERKPSNIRSYVALLNRICEEEELRELTNSSKQLLVEEAVRKTADQSKLTLQVAPVADLLRTANHSAEIRKSKQIEVRDINSSLESQDSKIARIRRLSYEAITNGRILIDLAGEVVGQVNALSVLGIGDSSFGKPSRITARTRMGNGKMIDVERQVELGGALHSKGVMILSSYLAATYARDLPVALSATLVFEQSYSGVDGDSASTAELCTLLSSLSELPIRQGLAITGSINQFGQVQAIGGVNQKIEGFFDICHQSKKGLDGGQGVLIPASNVHDLMLKKEVVEACREGLFTIWPISTIDQAISLLTGVVAGNRNKSTGQYPAHSVNRLVEDKLISFSENRKSYNRKSFSGPKPETT